MVPAPSSSSIPSDPDSIKIALAVALLRFKKLRNLAHSPSPSDSHRWRTKAKERKREILRLREEIKQLEEDSKQRSDDDLQQIAACKCHFYDDCGKIGGNTNWIDDVLRRRFLRLVRWKERRKSVERPLHRRHFFEFSNENEFEKLCTSIDFLVELSSTIKLREPNASFSTLSHQATDYILASLKNLLSSQKDSELIEETINGLILRLTRMMCGIQENSVSGYSDSDAQFFVQHLIRKLGNEPFIGLCVTIHASQKISITADSLLVMDPFDVGFPALHDSMYMMIQLMEFLILDSLQSWTMDEYFDARIYEEWVRLMVQARKALELLEYRNSIYMLYMERVFGVLIKQVGPLANQGKLGPDILATLLGYQMV